MPFLCLLENISRRLFRGRFYQQTRADNRLQLVRFELWTCRTLVSQAWRQRAYIACLVKSASLLR